MMKQKQGNDIVLISLPFISYYKRVLYSIIDWGILLFFVFIPISFLLISKYLSLLLFIFAIVYFFTILKETKIYITKIIINNNEVKIYYYFKNSGIKNYIFNKNTLTVEWFSSVKGNIKGTRIIISDKTKKITQFSVGKWNKKTISDIYTKLKLISSQK